MHWRSVPGFKLIDCYAIDMQTWAQYGDQIDPGRLQGIYGTQIEERAVDSLLIERAHTLSEVRQGFELQYGWPMYTMYWCMVTDPATPDTAPVERGLLEIGTDSLPLYPIFPGFLINTLVYSGVWIVIFFSIAALVRPDNRRRGRCPMCGYDLRGAFDSGCSECGWNRSELRQSRG